MKKKFKYTFRNQKFYDAERSRQVGKEIQGYSMFVIKFAHSSASLYKSLVHSKTPPNSCTNMLEQNKYSQINELQRSTVLAEQRNRKIISLANDNTKC